ncbi:MAG: LysM peptidoglycan-binding domain-containing protein, partial [Deltaproteobacteria bacterium]|nr:LysM peptidoglycan-binding domain-containing protein [Deltaproteobacteria bacterium]
MRILLVLMAMAALLSAGGCRKQAVHYESRRSAQVSPQPAQVSPQPAQTGQGPLYVLHRWKKDDTLSFLALFYAGHLAAQKEIEAANPDLKFVGRLPQGTPIWIPAEVVLPEVRHNFQLVERTDQPELLPATPLERGVVHQVRSDESLRVIAAFYTGDPENAGKIAAANPGLDPAQATRPGQEIFIPAELILKDLRSRLTFSSRPRPKTAA